MKYDLHRFCMAFRRATAREKAEIVATMKTSGYDREQPITLYEGKILDGATRQDAADEAGVEPTFTTFTGTDDQAIAFVIRRNKARKHMTQGQLDLAGARLVTAKQGAPKGAFGSHKGYRDSLYGKADLKTREVVAKELGRSPATVKKSREVIARAAPNVLDMIEAGDLSVSTAADGIRGRTKDEQAKMTAADLRKISNEYKAKGSGRRGRPALKVVTSESKPAVIAPPRINLSKLDIGTERIPGQPVLLQPARVQRLQDARIRVTGITGRVQGLATMDLQQLADDLDQMFAYEPVKRKKNGEEQDFASDARKRLATLNEHIEEAIKRLAALRDIVASHKVEC
jgi:hypothetical protein